MSLLYFWRLESGESIDVRRILEQLRQKAVELRWEPVSEVVKLEGNAILQDQRLRGRHLFINAGEVAVSPAEVMFFTACPPGNQPEQFGLACYTAEAEAEGQVPSGWTWVGVIRTDDLQPFRELMQFAEECGLEVAHDEMSDANNEPHDF